MILSTQNFYNPYPQFADDNGNPLSLGRLEFYSAGTSTLKAIYTDVDLSVPAQNPQPLGGDGRSVDGPLFLGAGSYKVICFNSLGDQVWVADNVQGSFDDGSTLVSFAVVANIAALKALTPGLVGTALVLDYYDNDRGGGVFEWDGSSTQADDGGAVIRPASLPPTGAWLRKFSGQSGVLGDQFGVVPNGSPIEGQLVQANTYCNANKLGLTIRGGTYTLSASVNLNGAYNLTLDGASFTSATGATLTLGTLGLEILGYYIVRLSTLNLVIASQIPEVSPVWWGAVGDGTTDNYSAFIRMTGRHSAPVRIDRAFYVSAVGAPSIDLIVLFGANFYIGGYINVNYTDPDKFQIGQITAQDKAYYGIRATDLVVYTFVDKAIQAKLFFDINPSLGRLTLTTTELSQIITSHATLSLRFDGYDYTHNASVGAWSNPCIIESGTLIYTTGVRTFGYVQASSTQTCFALGSGGIGLVPANKKLYSAWYGVLTGLSTSAFDFLTASDSAKQVDFDGNEISVNYSGNQEKICNFINGSIDSIGSAYLIFGGGSKIQNFTLNGLISYRSATQNEFTNCTFQTFTKGDFSGNPVNAQFVNCVFNGEMNFKGASSSSLLRLDGDVMTFIGCTINGLLSMYQKALGDQSFNKFSSCIFTHDDTSTSASTTFVNSLISNCIFSDLTYCQMYENCTLIGSYNRATDTTGGAFVNGVMLQNTGASLSEMAVNVIGNHLSQFAIRGVDLTDATTIVRGINIQGNYFDPIGVTTPFDALRILSGSNIAPSGHDCQIVNNTARNGIGNLGSTCGTLTIKLGSGNREALDSSKVILPKNTTDSSNFDVNQFYFKAT